MVRCLPAGGSRIRTVGSVDSKAGTGLLTFDREELVGRGFGPPNLAFATSKLPHAGVAVGQRKGFEPLGLGIKPQDRICSPVAHPHGIGVIDVDSVGLRPVARQMPALPTIVLAIVAEQISTVPTGNPQSAAAIAPDAPCALPRHGRLQDRGGAGLDIDPTEIA